MIPKRIICTHVSQHTLEPKLRYCMKLMRELHPRWDFLFFSDGDARDFVKREFPEYLELYDWYPRPVLKADMFRLLAVERLGGFYLDTDFMLKEKLDPLCRENAVFAYEHNISDKNFNFRYPKWLRAGEERWTLANYAFGAESGHPFLAAILDELVNRTQTFEAEDCNDIDSLKRSGFMGDIKIIHNGDTEIFDCPHPNVEEIRIDSPPTTTDCYQVKFQARKLLSVEDYDWVLFLDTDIIVSTNLDGWFDGPEIIRYTTEPMLEIQLPQFNGFLTEDEMSNLKRDGINSGAFVIKAEYFREVLALWEKIDAGEAFRGKGSDQPAWNRLVLDTRMLVKLLADPEVKYFYHHSQLMQMMSAPLLHYCGCWDEDKIQAMQAKFITHFHTDEDGTLIRQLAR